jgi:hypothetical protein
LKTLFKIHEQYGPIVRVGPNEVSIADWKVYREIYGSQKASVKETEFYGAAKFLGHENIFSMRRVAQTEVINALEDLLAYAM